VQQLLPCRLGSQLSSPTSLGGYAEKLYELIVLWRLMSLQAAAVRNVPRLTLQLQPCHSMSCWRQGLRGYGMRAGCV